MALEDVCKNNDVNLRWEVFNPLLVITNFIGEIDQIIVKNLIFREN